MQDKTVLVTGATGFIGSYFSRAALAKGMRVIALSRSPEKAHRRLPGARVVGQLEELPAAEKVDYLVNLAGEPLVSGRWNEARKRLFLQSRVGTTDRLFEHFSKVGSPPSVMVSGSAVGYYGPHNDRLLDEAGRHHDSFSHRLCAAWERSATRFEQLGTRVCHLRTGIVLGKGQGVLARMVLPFSMGLGGAVGIG